LKADQVKDTVMVQTASPIVKPVTLLTRLILILAALLAIIAGIQLYVFTDFTATWFTWTIAAPLSATFIGAGCWTGAILLLLSARERAWANTRIALAAVAAFVPLMLLTTLLHLDRFHLGSDTPTARIAAWAWLIVYLVVPFLVLAILAVQAIVPGADPARLAPVSPWLRALLGSNAAIAFVLGLALFLLPDAMTPLWAWPLTPLTGRAIGAGFLTMTAASVWFLRENDWNRARVGTIPYLLVGALQLLALPRYAGTIDGTRPGTWLYILFMLAVLLGGLYAAIMA
jgi:hypothetical protein